MSTKALDWAFNQKTGSPVTKLVLVKLADNANDDCDCWPSFNYICKHTELSRDSVMRHIAKLEELGLLAVLRRRVGTTNLPNQYRLLVVADSDQSRQHLPPLVADSDQGGSSRERGGVVAESDSNRHIEPSLKQKKSKEQERKEQKKPALVPLPTDFEVTEQHRTWAKEKGYRNPDVLIDEFRDHHLKKASKWADWDAAFRTWMRNDAKFNPIGGTQSAPRGNEIEFDADGHPAHLKIFGRDIKGREIGTKKAAV